MNNFLNLLNYYPGLCNKLLVILRWIICPFAEMEKYVPRDGDIVDIGCGEGIFSLYLRLQSKERKVYGLDLNEQKITLAQKAGKGITNLIYKKQNALTFNRKVTGIIISDAFHHFSRKDQEMFFQKVKNILNTKGMLIIKEINKDDFIRARLSRLWDYLLYPEDKINYWSKKQLLRKLENLGFEVRVKRAAILFPGSTMLYLCTKK